MNEELSDDLGQMGDVPSKHIGMRVGAKAAELILAVRSKDGTQYIEPKLGIDFCTKDAPGKWRQDPVRLVQTALGAPWGAVEPFVISAGSRFRVPPPPALPSREYAIAYNEVKQLGGDAVTTPTDRTDDQTFSRIFWAYDGTPGLCAPPRLYNQITMTIAERCTRTRLNSRDYSRL